MAIYLWKNTAPYSDQCGDQAQPSLEPFEVRGSRGAVIVCPGGGYSHKAAHEGAPVAKMINEAGISSFVLDYRVLPFPCMETPIGDALRAIRVVRSLGYEKVAILGFSAGGHLSSMAATMWDPGNPQAEDPVERLSSRPDAFVPCYSVSSFRLWKNGATALLGQENATARNLARYSAEMRVTADTPPAFLWHTTDDPISVENSIGLARALAAKNVPCEMHIYPHGRHGMGLAEDDETIHQWCAQLQRWLTVQGYAEQK